MPNVGDVVKLKSGGAQMTVLNVSQGNGVWCGWMDADSKFMQERLPSDALTVVELQPDPQPPRVNPPRKP